MKRKIAVRVIFRAALIFTLAPALFGCFQTPMEKYEHLISELRDNVFIAQSARYSVSIITGKREDPFIMDGHAGGMRDFTVITVDPAAGENTYAYRVTINGKEYAGKLLAHPFAKTYSADIQALSLDTEIALTITTDGQSETLTAKSVKTEQMISCEKAVEIAEKKLKNAIGGFRVNGVMNCEIYVRLMSNPIDNSGGYYWYVAFIGEDKTIYAALIEPVSMQVVAVRD